MHASPTSDMVGTRQGAQTTPKLVRRPSRSPPRKLPKQPRATTSVPFSEPTYVPYTTNATNQPKSNQPSTATKTPPPSSCEGPLMLVCFVTFMYLAARVVDAHTPGVPSGATYVPPAAPLPPAAWQWQPFGF